MALRLGKDNWVIIRTAASFSAAPLAPTLAAAVAAPLPALALLIPCLLYTSRDLRDELFDRLHWGAVADEGFDAPSLPKLVAQPPVLAR